MKWNSFKRKMKIYDLIRNWEIEEKLENFEFEERQWKGKERNLLWVILMLI